MHKRRVVEVIMDFALIGAAYYTANRLRFDVEAYAANAESFYGSLPIVIGVQLMAFFIVGVYRGVWHVFIWRDAITVLKGVLLGASGIALLVLAMYDYTGDPRMIFVYYAALLAAFVICARGSLGLLEYSLR
jgi:UDP-GlcNAc:undecaprenyl-phosphate GlcNAc-1-phosphate transferase